MGVEVSEDYADHVDLINLIDPAKFSLLDTIESVLRHFGRGPQPTRSPPST